MNKGLSKVFMTRSRLRNKYFSDRANENKVRYNKQRNYCENLLRKSKRDYYNNLDVKLVIDNKKFWKTVKPLFSEKHSICRNTTLIEGDNIISNDLEVVVIMNNFFSSSVINLGKRNQGSGNPDTAKDDPVNEIINKYRDHPSIVRDNGSEKFSFSTINEDIIINEIKNLNRNKPTTYNDIPAKFLIDNVNVCAPYQYITSIYNATVLHCTFPDLLKMADITQKKDETTLKNNYRPVSILPSVSNIFERIMYNQIWTFIEKY